MGWTPSSLRTYIYAGFIITHIVIEAKISLHFSTPWELVYEYVIKPPQPSSSIFLWSSTVYTLQGTLIGLEKSQNPLRLLVGLLQLSKSGNQPTNVVYYTTEYLVLVRSSLPN